MRYLILSICLVLSASTFAERTILHAGTLLAVPGETPRSEQSVIVDDGRIVAVKDGYVTEPGATIVDLKDRFVLPGLMDMHTHLTGQLGPMSKWNAVTQTEAATTIQAAVYARRTLEAGFTTVRNIGGDPNVIFALRDGIRDGKLPGPRILAAGAAISGTGGHADEHGFTPEVLELLGRTSICDGADDCRRAVRAQVKRGSDWLKITATGGVLSETAAGTKQQMFNDELQAVVETARMLGRRVAAHAHGLDGINAALRAGVTTIEHGTYGDESSFRLYKEKGAYLVPTIMAGEEVLRMAEESDFMAEAVREKARRIGPVMLEMVGRAHRAGVKIAFGTDCGVSPHGTNAREFELMVEAGIPPMEAIVSATVTTAELLGLSDEIGTIEPGKQADIVAAPGNPLENIGTLKQIDFVMRGGQVLNFNIDPGSNVEIQDLTPTRSAVRRRR